MRCLSVQPFFSLSVFIISLFGLALASFTDLKQRIVPNKLNIFLLSSGLFLHAIISFLQSSLQPLLYSAFATAYSFLFAYLLYKAGVWAGGDVKLFAAIAALNPVNPFVMKPTLESFAIFHATLPVFPIELFVFTIFAMMPVSFAIMLKRAERNIRRKLISLLAAMVAIIALLFVLNASANYIALAALAMLSYLIIACLPLARVLFVREKKITELEEGDICGESIRLVRGRVVREKDFNMRKLINYLVQYKNGTASGNEIVSPLRARGVTLEEIAKLRELVANGKTEDRILVKESVPMVPAIFIAYVVLNIVGDLLWALVF